VTTDVLAQNADGRRQVLLAAESRAGRPPNEVVVVGTLGWCGAFSSYEAAPPILLRGPGGDRHHPAITRWFGGDYYYRNAITLNVCTGNGGSLASYQHRNRCLEHTMARRFPLAGFNLPHFLIEMIFGVLGDAQGGAAPALLAPGWGRFSPIS
jgi:hypothetical protein